MLLKLQITGCRAIVYDANRISQPDANLFDPEHWLSNGAVASHATGRGNALVLDTPFGPAVLRQYLRGGAAARFSRNRYLFLGYSRSRPVVEANLTSHLLAVGLPVPQVLGGLCHRQGLTYTGALLTQQIPHAKPLADLMSDLTNKDPIWPAIGKCIRRFHEAGIYHADLNARNILVDEVQNVWLIDFDRGRVLHAGHPRLQSNLQRLLRSLNKQTAIPAPELGLCWEQLMLAYNTGY